jgi:hypothetical protein
MAGNGRGSFHAGSIAAMPKMTCPKCGYQQENALECARCGIVFARYRPEGRDLQRPTGAQHVPPECNPFPGVFRILFRVFRWLVPAFAISALILVLRPSPPPRINLAPEVVEQSEVKLHEFEASVQTGGTRLLELNQSEVNAWLNANLAIKRPQAGASRTGPEPGVDQPAPAEETEIKNPEPGTTAPPAGPQASLTDVRVELLNDSLRLYTAYDFHGKSLSLELEGRLITRDGYLRLDPTGGKLGSLPLPASVLETAIRQIFDAPENREKFRLPARIEEIKVENGSLVVIPRK